MNIRAGDRVIVCAADDFFGFIDGWVGTVTGFTSGVAIVKCLRPDGEKTFFIPPAQLAITV